MFIFSTNWAQEVLVKLFLRILSRLPARDICSHSNWQPLTPSFSQHGRYLTLHLASPTGGTKRPTRSWDKISDRFFPVFCCVLSIPIIPVGGANLSIWRPAVWFLWMFWAYSFLFPVLLPHIPHLRRIFRPHGFVSKIGIHIAIYNLSDLICCIPHFDKPPTIKITLNDKSRRLPICMDSLCSNRPL